MEQITEAITQLTGAMNAQIEQVKQLNNRMVDWERKLADIEIKIGNPVTVESNLALPKTPKDLDDIRKLPDCVRDLQIFEGNPVQYISWVHSVESILRDYEIVREKPIYRAILQHIRQKVRGPADTALISYNIFDESWDKIKNCLSLHYADKRDLQTLEYELSTMRQKNNTIDEFYARVNHQLSLIINKLKTDNYSVETVEALISCYRNRALDVFIRGINGDVSRMLTIQKPRTLPEAYTSCLEFQNLHFRNISIHPRYSNNVTTPINQMSKNTNFIKLQAPQRPLNVNEKVRIYNTPIQPHLQTMPPPRPTQPKPPVPMEVDPSIRSRQINYMNRPEKSPLPYSSNNSSNIPRKQQRIFNTETVDNQDQYPLYENNQQDDEDLSENNCYEEETEFELNELNFTMDAYPAFLT